MAYFKVTSFLCIFLVIHHSLAVLNKFERKIENTEAKRTVCGGGDVVHGNDEILEPIGNATKNLLSVKVNKVIGAIKDRRSSVSSEYELPLATYTNFASIYAPSKSHQSHDYQMPQKFSSQSLPSSAFSQFANNLNAKRMQFGMNIKSAISPFRYNQMKSLNIRMLPTTLEAYGPPKNKPGRSYFSSAPSSTQLSEEHHAPPPISHQIQNSIYNSPTSNIASLAPPTPPDITYDGWKPIPGHNFPSNYISESKQFSNIHGTSSSSSNNDFNQLSGNEIAYSSNPLFEFSTSIPSNSYGEPITNAEDHNLKQSVHQSQISNGLPPPEIPDGEPFHVNQGPTKMIYSTMSPASANTVNHNQHLNELEGLTLPNNEVNNNLLGLEPPRSFNNPHNNDNYKNHNGYFENNDLLSQQLPILDHKPLTTFSNFAEEFSDTYSAPPPSSFSSSGPYPSARRPLYFADPLRNQFKLANSNGNRNIPKFMYPRSRGLIRSQLMFPVASLIGNLIPPRTSSLVNFRQSVPPQLPSKSIYNNYPSISSSSISSGIYDMVGGNNLFKNYQYSTDFDSHASPSLNQHELSHFSTSNESKIEENKEQTNEIGHDNANYKFDIKLADGMSPSLSDDFKNFHDENGVAAQALAQTLVSEDASSDDIQIQGSRDTYILRIEPANGEQSVENTDGTIKHDQILSNQLLQDIISAIEDPENEKNIKIRSNPPVQLSQELSQQSKTLSSPSSSYSSFRTHEIDEEHAASQLHEKAIDASAVNHQKESDLTSNQKNAVLFFDSHYEEPMNKITSTLNNENSKYVTSLGNGTNNNL